MTKIAYVLELTEQEAAALAVLTLRGAKWSEGEFGAMVREIHFAIDSALVDRQTFESLRPDGREMHYPEWK